MNDKKINKLLVVVAVLSYLILLFYKFNDIWCAVISELEMFGLKNVKCYNCLCKWKLGCDKSVFCKWKDLREEGDIYGL